MKKRKLSNLSAPACGLTSTAAMPMTPERCATLPGELARTLATVAMLAIGRGYLAQASTIMFTLQQFRPDSMASLIGRALIAIAERKPQAAVALLQNSIDKHDENDGPNELHGFLALALMLTGRKHEARLMVEQLDSATAPPQLLQFAHDLRQELARREHPAVVGWTAALPAARLPHV